MQLNCEKGATYAFEVDAISRKGASRSCYQTVHTYTSSPGPKNQSKV
jgi:hypothetical protein